MDKLLTIDYLSDILINENICIPKTQYDLYKKQNSPYEIAKLAIPTGKTFGAFAETITNKFFKMDPRNGSGHDHNKINKKIELKSVRYTTSGKLSKFQHIEMQNDWEYLMLFVLNFDCIEYYITSREIVQQLIDCNVITGQGKYGKPAQGYWFDFTSFKNKKVNDFFTKIETEKDLIEYLQTQN